eukprot:CAMPEP_0173238220 /NCGR_PEP_ID=MMETSP1142-20121109/12511_1 /TAXON_ID=483371 /ORGANISM="non described non described, Strain CCMP2298" /LENGTH=183 /DNA_ID=CAMNT_0014169049 /DNA_START=23 /DNA_END=571 /DNA_ORIENTATION=+
MQHISPSVLEDSLSPMRSGLQSPLPEEYGGMGMGGGMGEGDAGEGNGEMENYFLDFEFMHQGFETTAQQVSDFQLLLAAKVRAAGKKKSLKAKKDSLRESQRAQEGVKKALLEAEAGAKKEVLRLREVEAQAEGARMRAQYAAKLERRRSYERELAVATAHNLRVGVYLEGLGKLQRKLKALR